MILNSSIRAHCRLLRKMVARMGAIDNLASKQYWHRLRIVQGFIVATDLVIRCGSRFVDWTSFNAVVQEFINYGADSSIFDDNKDSNQWRRHLESRLLYIVNERVRNNESTGHSLTLD